MCTNFKYKYNRIGLERKTKKKQALGRISWMTTGRLTSVGADPAFRARPPAALCPTGSSHGCRWDTAQVLTHEMKTRLLFLILVPKHSCFFLFPQLNLKTVQLKTELRKAGGRRERPPVLGPYSDAAELHLAGEASTATSKLASGRESHTVHTGPSGLNCPLWN